VVDSGIGHPVTGQQAQRGAAGLGLGEAVVGSSGLHAVVVEHEDERAGDDIAGRRASQLLIGLIDRHVVAGEAAGQQEGCGCTSGQDTIEREYLAHESFSLGFGLSLSAIMVSAAPGAVPLTSEGAAAATKGMLEKDTALAHMRSSSMSASVASKA